jgi:hypothetical protein
MAAATINPQLFWRPFFYDQLTSEPKVMLYKEQYPHTYHVTLPRAISQIKSIRLLSTEMPNTVNNITDRNNIIVINLRYLGTTTDSALSSNGRYPHRPVALDSDQALFNFILVKLEVGPYTLETLLTHMESKINSEVARQTSQKLPKVFRVSMETSGAISISCQRKELEFHLKFYTKLAEVHQVKDAQGEVQGNNNGIATEFSNDLWYMLGFPWPFELNTDTTDKYTQTLTNVVYSGVHEAFRRGHARDDIFDRELDTAYEGHLPTAAVLGTRPYRYPCVDKKYIYLVIKGYKNIEHINQHNHVIDFVENDIFAKVQLNVAPGQVAYNSFVSNPLIFTNIIDKISTLDISWIDERGEPVDFGKADHSFTLEFIQYILQEESNEYDTKLGIIDRKSYPSYFTGESV